MTRPGDLLLVAGGNDWESRVIRAGTHSHWTHVAIFMDAGQLLAEATHSGIAFAHAEKYGRHETHWIDVGLTDDQRAQACRFASSCIGQRYGKMQIAAITLAWLSGQRLYLGMENTETCSSFAARCIEHGGAIIGKAPELFRPRDFADLFNVTPRLEAP
jgi:hypothetical protein